jgi:DNA polymerase IV
MRCCFLDMNAFFASVEQQERTELRGKPIIVAPIEAETTCAIAASYEAKAWGIKTGTSVKTARKLCPGVKVIPARPQLYLEYHRGILEVLERHFVDVKPLSVDEMACVVGRFDRGGDKEERLARQVKQDIRERLGAQMTCSVGVAPNVFLAKVAAETKKPDGLTLWQTDADVEAGLCALALMDLPGIGRRMAARLERAGIETTAQLLAADRIDLRRAWGSIVGERWYEMLRGSVLADYGMYEGGVKKSVSHSHVLPPEFRTMEGVKLITMRLFSKCMKRLRRYGQAASDVEVRIGYKHPETHSTHIWKRGSKKHRHANDELTWGQILRPIVDKIPSPKPQYVPCNAAVTFSGLIACQDMNLSLFDDPMERTFLCSTMDALNELYGHVVDVASVFWVREQAPKRIPFGQLQ